MFEDHEGSGPTDREPALDTEGHGWANDNETLESDDGKPEPTNDTEGHRLSANDNETVESDEGKSEPAEDDTEGHGIWQNDNETVVDDNASVVEDAPTENR